MNTVLKTEAGDHRSDVALPFSVVLTDSPRVVDLKREFSGLDGREEEIKLELERVRAHKRQIAWEIFGTGR